jgi:hypothetical protein
MISNVLKCRRACEDLEKQIARNESAFSIMTRRRRLGKACSRIQSDGPRPMRDLGKLSGLSWTEGPSACVQQVRSALIYFSYV